jgi:hypothetical protein
MHESFRSGSSINSTKKLSAAVATGWSADARHYKDLFNSFLHNTDHNLLNRSHTLGHNLHKCPSPAPYTNIHPAAQSTCQQFDGAEPMEFASGCQSETSESGRNLPVMNNAMNGEPTLEKQNSSDSLMQIESDMNDKNEDGISDDRVDPVFSEDDALLLTDLFYMPFEHGAQGLFFLQKLHWLRNNAQAIGKNNNEINQFEVIILYRLFNKSILH